MKITDLLRQYGDQVEELIQEIREEINLEETTTDESLDLIEENFSKIRYTDLYNLIDFLRDIDVISERQYIMIDENQELQDIDKEIFYSDFVILEVKTQKYFKANFHTGYYNFPLQNEMKEVQKKTRIEEYYD